MNTTEKNLVSNATNIISDIKKYISSNDNWIFYFINPLLDSGNNKPLYDIIETYHDEWSDYIDFNVTSIGETFVGIDINVDDGSEDGIILHRYIYLNAFEDTVNRNMKIYGGGLNELRIKKVKEEIAHYESCLASKKEELERLLNV